MLYVVNNTAIYVIIFLYTDVLYSISELCALIGGTGAGNGCYKHRFDGVTRNDVNIGLLCVSFV